MADEALENVRVTAERVQRFVADVEEQPGADTRQRWRASLDDLRDSIRQARAEGCDTAAIQAATSGTELKRFQRTPLPADDAQPAPSRSTV